MIVTKESINNKFKTIEDVLDQIDKDLDSRMGDGKTYYSSEDDDRFIKRKVLAIQAILAL